MTAYDRDAAKRRRDRNALRDEMRSRLAAADRLEMHGAPAILVDHERRAAHAAKLRLWGWTGPVPFIPQNADAADRSVPTSVVLAVDPSWSTPKHHLTAPAASEAR